MTTLESKEQYRQITDEDNNEAPKHHHFDINRSAEQYGKYKPYKHWQHKDTMKLIWYLVALVIIFVTQRFYKEPLDALYVEKLDYM